MINDFQKDQFFSVFDELPLITNISFEMDTGKYVLIDNKGNNYICDLYGRKHPIFNGKISGIMNGKQRKIFRKVNSCSNMLSSNISKTFEINNKKEESKCYFPSINKFEGYAHFPRPVCPPFTNIPDYFLNDNYKKLLLCKLKQNYDISNDKNKKIFIRSNENTGLSYLTSDVKGYLNKEKNEENNSINYNIKDIKKKDYKTFLIKMIDNTINEYKKKYQCDLYELIQRFSLIKSILHLKKKLVNNNETNVINGRKLDSPNENIIKEYTIINNKFNNFSVRRRKNEHKLLMKCYSQMINKGNKNFNNESIIKTFDKEFSKRQSSNRSVSISRDLNTSMKLDFDKGIQSKKRLMKINNNRKNNSVDFLNIIENKDNDSLLKNKTNEKNYIRSYISEEQETKESNITKNNHNLFNFGNNPNESVKDDYSSVISLLNENEKKNFLNFNKKIKYLRSLKINSEKEKQYLKGFQKKEPKKPKVLFNIGEDEGPKLKDFSEIYKKEQENLEKINPILFDIQKKKEESELKKLIKKKEFKKLTETLIMKGRRFKVNKSPED